MYLTDVSAVGDARILQRPRFQIRSTLHPRRSMDPKLVLLAGLRPNPNGCQDLS